MIVIHHNKDMDGYASGAICQLKYPDAKLIGWDYKDPIPDFAEFVGEDVLMIDITFPIKKLMELALMSRLTVIDHHVSFAKDFKTEFGLSDETFNPLDNDLHIFDNKTNEFTYVYQNQRAACEIGWQYLFPNKSIPKAITLIGRYDTWRQQEGNWKNETLPFKYFMYGQCNSSGEFPLWLIFDTGFEGEKYLKMINDAVESGKDIMKYQEMMDEAATRAYHFEKEAYGVRAIVLNVPYFSTETVKSYYNPDKHDIMVGFNFSGGKWIVSLRSAKPEIDVSLIAKARGGGGHKGAAGFEVDSFEKIFL